MKKIRAYRTLMRKPERMRLPERPRRRCEHNIKMNLREIEWGGIDWFDLVQDRDQ
jgi:hypothetical protein